MFDQDDKRNRRPWINLVAAGLLFVSVLMIAVLMSQQGSPAPQPVVPTPIVNSSTIDLPEVAIDAIETEEAKAITELHELLALDPSTLGDMDLARMNLLCARGLPGAEGMDIEKELAVLDRWAAAVKHETERSMGKFLADPGDYNNSEGYYRILALITVLQRDFDVRYNPERIYTPDFSDCRDVFLHGLTQGSTDEEHPGGTCVSMPVVYVAVARRLGYPVKLVTTREHVFARWEDERERFNIEATSQGLNTYPDEHYRTFPNTLTDNERRSGAYLRSLTPAQELGLFMAGRGYVLEDTGRKNEATIAYAYAHALDPVSIDSFDNLGRSVIRQLKDYPAVLDRNQAKRPPDQGPDLHSEMP